MNRLHVPGASTVPPRNSVRRLACAATLAMAVQGPAIAQQPGMPADAAPIVARAQQAASEGSLDLTPEISAMRTWSSLPGPAAYTPDGRQLHQMAAVDYRLWVSRGRTDLGVGLGTLGYVAPPFAERPGAAVQLTGAVPTLSVGLRYHLTPRSSVYADASGARRFGDDAGLVNTQVGVEWKPAKSRFGFENGKLGLHLDSGYHLSLRAKRGGLGLYLRGQF